MKKYLALSLTFVGLGLVVVAKPGEFLAFGVGLFYVFYGARGYWRETCGKN